MAAARHTRLLELARLFLGLGATAFGGPAVHVALMEDAVVRRRGWLTHEEFLDLLGATNLIPGPNSTEMAIHVGHRRAGWAGLVVAGCSFILPAALLVAALAWAYVSYGALPEAQSFLYGMKPVVIVVVVQALWRLGRTATRTAPGAAATVLAVVASLAGLHEIAVLLAAGLFTLAVASARGKGRAALGGLALGATGGGVAAPFGLTALFLFFAKVGAVLFGSGYVLFAFLRADLVDRWRWLTEAQLLDAIAVGQVTPGPLFTTATFIGYLLAGGTGAVVATAGIFLPAFVFVAASGPLVPLVRRSPAAGAFLDGVNAASVALMVLVAWHLGRAAMVDGPAGALAIAAAILLWRTRVNVVWWILGGGAAGWILRTAGLSLAPGIR